VPGGGDAQLGRLGVLATACCDGAVRAWAAPASGYVGAPSLLDLAPRFCASVPGGGAATAVRWSPADSALLLAASSTGSVVAWRIPNLGKAVRGAAKAVPELLLSFAPGGSDAAEFLSASIAWCPFNAALFATATVDGWLRVWNVEEGGAMTWERQLSGQPGGAQVEWMPDGRGIYAASTATGGVVGITWSEPESLVLRHAAPLTAFSVRPASASCRSTLLASAGRDGKLQVGADNGSSRGHNGNGDERPMRTWVVQQESHADAEETRPGPGGGATEKKARRLIVKTELIEVSESLYSRTDNFIRDERDGDGEKKNNTGGSKGLLLDAPSNPSPLRRIAFGRDESDGVVCAGGAGGIVRVCTLPDEILGRADPSSILRVAEV
jgi:WD40 repeat protein